ncbi:MAG: dipeptide epimerase [Sphingomonas sp.]|uniref:dipeptide epimerase n=1 Tax=Sphingomonas sp. TaxID=28214 RepID=UPI0025EB8069|nr:dipeptide epimerase [Sphingomonas sp.]MBX9880371.1 dipeptide epimerase [Sphingomonas sp.]
MTLRLEHWERSWPLAEPFTISRGTDYEVATLQVRLTDARGNVGRAEAIGIPYHGDTPATIAAEIEAVRAEIERGIDREALLDLLPAGGARHGIDAALWDLEAKRDGISPFVRAGVSPAPLDCDRTIGMRSLDGYETMARQLARHRVIKVKVGLGDERDLAAIDAVRRGAPTSELIIDPNQAWSPEQVREWSQRLAAIGVVLLEQPIAVGAEAALDGWQGPVPIAADELIDDIADLDKAENRFQFINIKLDKSGGLTAGLKLADEAQRRGFGLMIGCMNGSSLSMAPGMVLAQRCRFVDLDGPPAQTEDWQHGFVYIDGRVERPHVPALWG